MFPVIQRLTRQLHKTGILENAVKSLAGELKDPMYLIARPPDGVVEGLTRKADEKKARKRSFWKQ